MSGPVCSSNWPCEDALGGGSRAGLIHAVDFAFSLLEPLSELLGGKASQGFSWALRMSSCAWEQDAALARMLQMLKPSSYARWVLCYPRQDT